jgi:three-Cys-motif partner protein
MTDYSLFTENQNDWGGPWTERKLEAFSKYVWSYLKIMKKNPYWKTIYFDGFAGSGNRSDNCKSELYRQLKFSLEEESGYKGAAQRVINLKDGLTFDYYYFIDSNETSLSNLKRLLSNESSSKNKQLVFKFGDANKWVIELASVLKSNNYAALVFLDPFGMQINWDSIAALANTRSDIWILVPTGVIVNRLLDKRGELRSIEKLQSFFGLSADEIKKSFYYSEQQNTIFGEEELVRKVSKPIEKIARLYIDRLKTVWTNVIENPLILNNSKGVPIFHFVFASNNKNAVKIANQIIQSV